MGRIEELKRLEAGATAANWWIEATGTHPEDSRYIHGPCGDDTIQVCDLHSWNAADCNFIVTARNAIPALLRVVEAAKDLLGCEADCPDCYVNLRNALRELEGE